MRILVTFAIDAEFAPWRKLREFEKSDLSKSSQTAGLPGFTTSIEGNSVQVVLTGMGSQACEETLAQIEFRRGEGPDLVISSGLAGGLVPALKPGDTIVPHVVRTLKNDSSGMSDVIFLERAIQSGGIRIDTLITSTEIVQTVQEKAKLAFFGEAVDMESAYVMAKCARAAVPCMTIRSISDTANEDLPLDFERVVTPKGAVKPLNLMSELIERPSQLPKLIKFGKQSNQAAQKLIVFLDSFVVALPKFEVATP
jgi:adenosylhomocysteine nucleosidase